MDVDDADTTGEECVEGGRGCARGVFIFEFVDTAGEWYAWGVVGVLGDAPFPPERCEGLREDAGEAAAAAGDCWA
jgi:hypothetical protein